MRKSVFLDFLGRLRPGGLYRAAPHVSNLLLVALRPLGLVLPGEFLIHVRILSGLTILLRPATTLMTVNTASLVPDRQNEN